jgi:hypothetical protein
VKALLISLILALSLPVTPNDKGNGLGDVALYRGATSLQQIFEHGFELSEVTFKRLSHKPVSVGAGGQIQLPWLREFARQSSPLVPHSPGSVTLASPEIQRFAWVLAEALKLDDDILLAALFTENPDFLAAVDTRPAREQVAGLGGVTSEARVRALQEIRLTMQGFWSMLESYVISRAGAERWQRFQQRIGPVL